MVALAFICWNGCLMLGGWLGVFMWVGMGWLGMGGGMLGVPTVVAPGCLDMVNFGEPATVPARFAGRLFYHHNPQVTLMRTSPAPRIIPAAKCVKRIQPKRYAL